jgi:hypothetical protein
MMSLSRFLLVVTAFPLLSSAGCGGGASVSKSQYDRLKLGYTSSEVEEILGKGKDLDAAEVDRVLKESLPGFDDPALQKNKPSAGDFRGVRWGTEKKNITVIFQNDKLFRRFQQGL